MNRFVGKYTRSRVAQKSSFPQKNQILTHFASMSSTTVKTLHRMGSCFDMRKEAQQGELSGLSAPPLQWPRAKLGERTPCAFGHGQNTPGPFLPWQSADPHRSSCNERPCSCPQPRRFGKQFPEDRPTSRVGHSRCCGGQRARQSGSNPNALDAPLAATNECGPVPCKRCRSHCARCHRRPRLKTGSPAGRVGSCHEGIAWQIAAGSAVARNFAT